MTRRLVALLSVCLMMVWAEGSAAEKDEKQKKPTVTVTGMLFVERDEAEETITGGEIADADGVTYRVVMNPKGKALLKALGDKRVKVTGVVEERTVQGEEEDLTERWITVKKYEEVKAQDGEDADDDDDGDGDQGNDRDNDQGNEDQFDFGEAE